MKPRVFFTCSGIVASEITLYLNGIFEIIQAGCKLSESEYEVISYLENVVGLIIGGEEKITLRILQNIKNLRWIIFIGVQAETFFSKEAWDYFQQINIPIYRTGGGLASVAAKTVAQICGEDILRARIARSGKWADGPTEELLKSQSVSVIGAGNVGLSVMKQLHGKCRIKYYDPLGARKEADDLGVYFEPDPDKVFEANIVSVHLAYVPGKTDGIATYDRLVKIAKNGMFINNSRAELVNPNAFNNFLADREDVISTWDVFWKEGKEFEDNADLLYRRISGMPNFILTCHTAAMHLPEITKKEYGEGLLKIIRENNLA
jgi:phosphoglycerate dehydrogenase-like enzyme